MQIDINIANDNILGIGCNNGDSFGKTLKSDTTMRYSLILVWVNYSYDVELQETVVAAAAFNCL